MTGDRVEEVRKTADSDEEPVIDIQRQPGQLKRRKVIFHSFIAKSGNTWMTHYRSKYCYALCHRKQHSSPEQ